MNASSSQIDGVGINREGAFVGLVLLADGAEILGDLLQEADVHTGGSVGLFGYREVFAP